MEPKSISSFTEKGKKALKSLYLYEGKHLFPHKDFPLFVRKGRHRKIELEHSHDFVELVFVAKGRGIHQIKKINTSGEVEETFSYGILQGDLFFLLPGEVHTYKSNENFVVYNVIFYPELLDSEMPELKELPGLTELFLNLDIPPNTLRQRKKIHLPLTSRAATETLLNRIIEELEFHKAGFRLSAKSLLLEFLVYVGRMPLCKWQYTTNIKDAQSRYFSIYKSITYMEKHLTEELTLKNLASMANLSLTYFCEQFKIVTGLSPWGYLTNLRLEKVKYLLASTEHPISEIAFKTGFCDNSYLARTFKKHEGISPREFRIKITGKKEI